VGDLYILGNATGTDGRTAGLWYQMGCDMGDGQACTAAGLWMERGDVMEADPKKAVQLFQQGCERGHARGCTLIGIRAAKGASGLKRDLSAAADWFLQACPDEVDGDPEGCRELGMMLVKGKGVGEDRTKGTERLDRACFANDAVGCRELAEVHQADKRYDEALVAAQRGCDLGEASACKRMEKVQFRMALDAAR
jgi:TPR repeat protein